MIQMSNQNWSCILFWVILLSGFLIITSEENSRKDDIFSGQFMAPTTGKVNEPKVEKSEVTTGEVNEQKVEKSQVHCRQDSYCVKETVAVFNLCFPGSKDTNGLELVSSLIDSNLRQTLLDCVQEKVKFLSLLGLENGKYLKYMELLSSLPNAPRRNLASRRVLSPSPSPSPPGKPKRSQGPPTKSRSPPAKSRSPPPHPPPAKKTSSKNSTTEKKKKEKKKEDHQKTIIIAVVATAVSTFLLAALVFLCCTKVCGHGSGGRKYDERPLLSLSKSDYSVGSSVGYGGSVKGDKTGPQLYNIYSNQGNMSSFDGSNSDISDGLGDSSEEMSSEPMRSSISSHGIPPLKPPPGRNSSVLSGMSNSGKVKPLAHEPPNFLKVSSNKASAPTPVPAPAAPPPPGPPPPRASTGPPRPAPPAPPPASGPRPPPPPGVPGLKGPRPPPPMNLGPKAPRPSGPSLEDMDAPKTKLKPFFWDKVQANPEQAMVWNDIRSGSFQFNEEMIESLFGYANADKNKKEKGGSSGQANIPQFIQILEPKKGQNLSILLKALNATTEEVCDALLEGNELPVEFIQTLLKMAPTPDEELKLRLYCGELAQLGTAERFLKAVVDIPFAFKRLEALLFMCTLHEEIAFLKESFQTLEVACTELRGSRLFLKLLEAVLKTGNRMNDGTFRGGAQAFKLDTLLKLADVKGADGKTTLLHFVVQEIIRSEGVRAARTTRESRSFNSVKTEDLMVEETSEESEENYRNLGLQKVSGLSSELENVKKAANIDGDSITGTVLKMGHALAKARDFVNSEMKSSDEESGFREALEDFIQNAEGSIMSVLAEEKRIMTLVKSAGDYFHGKAGKDEGLRLFVIVRDFLIILDKSCKEVRESRGKPIKMPRKQGSTASASSDIPPQPPASDPRQKLFPAIAERRKDQSSSDSDSD